MAVKAEYQHGYEEASKQTKQQANLRTYLRIRGKWWRQLLTNRVRRYLVSLVTVVGD
jgi:hypothetical protein